ncbi:MAG TPA: M1 family aminopeptidase [Blastocatellia bacterium]
MTMKRLNKAIVAALAVLVVVMIDPARTSAQSDEGPDIDVISYKINGELIPESHAFTGHAVVSFKPLKQTQSAVFEMNGSLAISAIKGPDGTALQFIQDKVNELNVKINLGKLYEPGSEIALTFDYAGQLATPEGGPIPEKRLAYIGPEGSYLFYAARWFPFHGYAADRATSDISLTVPGSWTVVGHSDAPVAAVTEKSGKRTFRFTESKPVLPGSFAAGVFINRKVTSGGLDIDVNVLPGSDSRIDEFSKEIAQILQFYNSKFGPYPFPTRFEVAEIDDESMETYTGTGILFLSHRLLVSDRELPVEVLARSVALQWWGQAVGLRRFDDEWVSQGLAEYSSVLYREGQETSSEFQNTLSAVLEYALAFEQDASIGRAPAQLNDQSPAYRSIVFYKGAYVFHMLRTTIGDDKFFQVLKAWYSTYNGKNVGIDDFEELTNKVTGSSMRGFFALWVDSTGVPEFRADYTILRTKAGKFLVRGTLRQNLDAFKGPVEVELEAEGGHENKTTVDLSGTSADFEIYAEGSPQDVIIDPNNRYLRTSDALRVSVVVRRGIEHLNRDEYPQAEADFKEALKLSPRSSWAHYNLGLMYLEQRNWTKAVDAFSETLNGDLRPSWLEVWSYIYRGNAYDANGQRDRAVTEYKKAQESGNDYNGAQKAVARYLAAAYKPHRNEPVN